MRLSLVQSLGAGQRDFTRSTRIGGSSSTMSARFRSLSIPRLRVQGEPEVATLLHSHFSAPLCGTLIAGLLPSDTELSA